MKNIGKYNGIPCYECSHSEYVRVYDQDNDDGKQIFIIDGNMVKNNVVVGYYDGHRVKDMYDGKVYWRGREARAASNDVMDFNKKPQTPASTGTAEIKEIVYSDYTKVVDDFFAHLNDPVV